MRSGINPDGTMRQTLNSQNRIVEYVGHFRLLRKVAAGGMATVYEAEQLGPAGFSKRIALKVIHEKFAQQPEWLPSR